MYNYFYLCVYRTIIPDVDIPCSSKSHDQTPGLKVVFQETTITQSDYFMVAVKLDDTMSVLNRFRQIQCKHIFECISVDTFPEILAVKTYACI